MFKDRFGGASSVAAIASYYQEEEERRKNEMFARQEQQRLIDTGVLNKDGTPKPERNPLQRFGDWIGDNAGDIASSMVEGTVRFLQGPANVVNELSGANKKLEDQMAENAEADYDFMQTALKKSKDTTLTEEQRKRWADLAKEYGAKWTQSQEERNKYYEDKVEKYDPTKYAWAAGEAALDAATMGTAGSIVRGGRGLMKAGQLATKGNTAKNLADPNLVKAAQKAADSRVTSAVNKVINPAGLKQSFVSGATLGVGYGITGTGVDQGSEADLGDFAKGAVTGAAFGGVLGGSADVAGRIGRSVFSKVKDRSSDTIKIAEDIIREAPDELVNQPGYVSRVNELAQSSRNAGEMKRAYNAYVNELKKSPEASTAQPAPTEQLMLGSGLERQRAENDEALAKLQSGEDNSIYDYRDAQGNDVGEVARGYDQRIADINAEIRDKQIARGQLDRQSQGINEVTGKADAPKMTSGSRGRPTLNVGMNVGDKTKLTPRKIKAVLKKEFNVEVKKATTQTSDSEPTYIPELSRPLTEQELYRLSEILEQDAIAHHTGDAGMLAGPKAADWGGEFNPEYYMDTDGVRFSEDIDPSTYEGDALGRQRAAEGTERYDSEIAELEARKEAILQEQSTAFERMGGVSRTVNNDRVKERFAELQAQRAAIDASESIMAESPQAIQKQIDDLDGGIIPDELIKDRGPAETIDDAVARSMKTDPQDVIGIQRVYQETHALREEAEEELSTLITAEKYDKYVADLSENYKLKEEELKELPKPLRDREQALLDEEYAAQVSDMEIQMNQDHGRVEELNEALRIADDIDFRAIEEWNSIEQSNPNVFGEVDEKAFDLYREKLVAKRSELALEQYKTMKPIQRNDDIDRVIADKGSRDEIKKELIEKESVLEAAEQMNLDELTTGNGNGANWFNYAMGRPAAVLSNEKSFGTSGQAFLDILTDALDARRLFNADIQARFKSKGWKNAMKPDYMDQSIKFLDEGTPLTRGTQESTAHFEKRQAAVDDIKSWFRETGEKLGLPEEMLSRNYLPHLIKRESGEEPDVIARTMAELRAGKDVNGKKLSRKERAKRENMLKGISPQTRQMIESRNLYEVGDNGFLKKRTGADDWETDLPTILSSYARAAANELYIKPASKKAQMIANKFNGKERRYLDAVMENVRGVGVEPGGKIAQGASVARRVQNVALMGASVRTTMLQLDGATRIFAESDIRSFTEASVEAFKAVKQGGPLYDEAVRSGALEDSFSQMLVGGGGLNGLANKGEKVLYSGIAAVDSHMRITAFIAGKRQYAKSIGKKVDELKGDDLVAAQKAGREMADKTQFNMGPLDTPVGQNTPLGKFFTQIQQFNINAARYNIQTLGGGAKALVGKGSKKDLQKAAKLVAAYGVMFGTMTSMTQDIFGEEASSWMNPLGFGPEDMLPFGEQAMSAWEIAKGEREWGDFDVPSTPLLSFMFGSSYGDGVTDYISTAIKYQRGEIDDKEYNAAMHQLPSFLFRNIVPAGTQINRSIEGWDVINRGESVNRYGNTRFLVQNKSGLNIMKGLIGGQYATDEGQEWLRKGMNTIDKSHQVTLANGEKMPVSQYARSLAPEDQAQYIGYYQTKTVATRELEKNGMSRSSVTDNLKDKIKAGTISIAQAQLEAQKWNDKTRMLYAPYINGNENIPPRLVDDFQNSVMIDITLFERLRGRSMSSIEQQNSYYE